MALNINGTTGISGVDGSVSAPALTGTDSNTGITFPSADTIKFATGGVERMSITNSGVSGITAGITMADQWRISDHFTVSTSETVISTNWERNDSTGYAGIGTGMTESSGVFTFPSTGIYLIKAVGTSYGSNGTINIVIRIQGRKNSGSYADKAQGSESAYTDNAYGTIYCETLFDVEDTTGDNIRLAAYSPASNQKLLGGSGLQRTGVTFLRLGDT